MSPQLKLSNHAKSVVNRCRNGERLCKSNGPKTSGYFYEPSGESAGQKSAEEAIASGLLKGLNDGLFDNSQTWVAQESLGRVLPKRSA
jgi:hypothetical protein